MSHLLVVEDNQAVGSALCAMLEFHGHTCSYAGNGAEAIALLDKTSIDVVVTDVRLPDGISGLDIADRANAAGIGCVLITGYDHVMFELEQRPHCVWLSKPFRGDALAQAIEAAREASTAR
jgi:DNA-binding NtrC family response regulator